MNIFQTRFKLRHQPFGNAVLQQKLLPSFGNERFCFGLKSYFGGFIKRAGKLVAVEAHSSPTR